MKSIFGLSILSILAFLELPGVFSSSIKKPSGTGSPERQSHSKKQPEKVQTSSQSGPPIKGQTSAHSGPPIKGQTSAHSGPPIKGQTSAHSGPSIKEGCAGLLNFFKNGVPNSKNKKPNVECPPDHMKNMGYLYATGNDERLKAMERNFGGKLKMDKLDVKVQGILEEWPSHHSFMFHVCTELGQETGADATKNMSFDPDITEATAYTCTLYKYGTTVEMRLVYISDQDDAIKKFLVHAVGPSNRLILSDFFIYNTVLKAVTLYPYTPDINDCYGLLNYLKKGFKAIPNICPDMHEHLKKLGYLLPENREKLNRIRMQVRDKLKMENMAKVAVDKSHGKHTTRLVFLDDAKKIDHADFLHDIWKKLGKELNIYLYSIGGWDYELTDGPAYECWMECRYTLDLYLRLVYINDQNESSIQRFLIYNYNKRDDVRTLVDYFTYNKTTKKFTFSHNPENVPGLSPTSKKSLTKPAGGTTVSKKK